MADTQDGFAMVCRRMQSLMREKPASIRRSPTPPLDDLIQRLEMIFAEQRAA
ncbi:MAG: hypothetical protein QHC67_05080 [Sphingobium sp.]|uniref:hypothetical protein n=1 Tax=Sphingobium sp. TaxID=1912891 RepID=UPI0029B0744C|nr:hypothetical protein [Sphingobium sp.]MDX3909175.1 hypothetical protein [Sphingobium sp.]